ncbi:MAG: 3-keto-disaccharide hydrolase [Planctomycetota bacterium]
MERAIYAFAGVICVSAAAWAFEPNALEGDERAAGFELLFDGKSLDGWDGDPKFWSAEDGAIVGRTTPEHPTRGNTFIFFRKGLLADFELRLEWKIEGGNSGVQFRSADYGSWVAGGYQADIDASGRFTGILYEERGRGILAERGEKVVRAADGSKAVAGRTAGDDELARCARAEGWNRYEIVARGNHIVQKLNGVTTVDFTDEEAGKRASSGVLALQLHAGPPMTVRFRSIRLRRLPLEGFEDLFDGRTLTGWKRHEGLPGHGVAGKWHVEDGAIVGVQDPPGEGGFLTTYRSFRDFEVEFETKIDWPFDSGAFLRTGPTGRSHQVTLDWRPGGEIGAIYIPWGPGFVCHAPEGAKRFKKDEWNKIRISCAGEPARIRVWVNGAEVTDFQHTEKTTEGVPPEGTFSLQVHPGGEGYEKSKACFRAIRIREIAREK